MRSIEESPSESGGGVYINMFIQEKAGQLSLVGASVEQETATPPAETASNQPTELVA
jgi:hypothetical protein